LGSIKLLVAIDFANSLYGRTRIQRGRSKASSDEVSLVVQTRKFLKSDWKNGACVLVADRAEIVDARDRLTVPLSTPLEVFGERVSISFDFIISLGNF
jgi:hypothetical protein